MSTILPARPAGPFSATIARKDGASAFSNADRGTGRMTHYRPGSLPRKRTAPASRDRRCRHFTIDMPISCFIGLDASQQWPARRHGRGFRFQMPSGLFEKRARRRCVDQGQTIPRMIGRRGWKLLPHTPRRGCRLMGCRHHYLSAKPMRAYSHYFDYYGCCYAQALITLYAIFFISRFSSRAPHRQFPRPFSCRQITDK